jgi:nitrogen fixation protein NifQ
MLATWYSGGGNMPLRLGLGVLTYQHLLARHFPDAPLPPIIMSETWIDLSRMPEREDLRALLQRHCVEKAEEAEWVTDIVVTGCLGRNHLWQDLGLWARKELTALMQRNFPTLAAKNIQDMKWKKFLYKQLCLQEGLYVCRTPSCEICIDYVNCFGAEE